MQHVGCRAILQQSSFSGNLNSIPSSDVVLKTDLGLKTIFLRSWS